MSHLALPANWISLEEAWEWRRTQPNPPENLPWFIEELHTACADGQAKARGVFCGFIRGLLHKPGEATGIMLANAFVNRELVVDETGRVTLIEAGTLQPIYQDVLFDVSHWQPHRSEPSSSISEVAAQSSVIKTKLGKSPKRWGPKGKAVRAAMHEFIELHGVAALNDMKQEALATQFTVSSRWGRICRNEVLAEVARRGGSTEQ